MGRKKKTNSELLVAIDAQKARTVEERKQYQRDYYRRPGNRARAMKYMKEYSRKNHKASKPRDKFPEQVRQAKTVAVTHSALQHMNVEKFANTITAIMNGRVVLSM